MKRCIESGINTELVSRADQRVLRLFGHVKRIDEYCMASKVLIADVGKGWVRGRQTIGWMV